MNTITLKNRLIEKLNLIQLYLFVEGLQNQFKEPQEIQSPQIEEERMA